MRSLVGGLILAVIIILAGGVLSMTVVRIREEAARASCKNKLHQIALSAHDYESAYGYCPHAAMRKPQLSFERRLSWLVEVLPFMEADATYGMLEEEKEWDADENRFVAFFRLRCFECPSYPDRPPNSPYFASHYIGIAGVSPDAAHLPREDPRAGFLGYERTITSGDLSSSTLLLAMETSRATGAWTAAGPPTVRGLEPDGLPYLGINGQFGGNHPGVANAVFADGSVRSLRESMDPKVLEAIATINGSAGVGSIDE